MKKKVIDLFPKGGKPNGPKYSELLQQLIKPFESDFPKYFDMGDIFEIGITAWNFALLKNLLPKEEFDQVLGNAPKNDPVVPVLRKLIAYKNKHFREHELLIGDYFIEEGKDGKPILTVECQDTETFFLQMEQEFQQTMEYEEEFEEEEFEENYIDRKAIIITPKEGFAEWLKKAIPQQTLFDDPQPRIYLVDDQIGNMEKWLKNKFNKIIKHELEMHSIPKKDWPKKRGYSLFNEWFTATVSTLLFDLEKFPVTKGE